MNIEEIKVQLRNLGKFTGKIAVCKSPNTKYYDIYKNVLENTLFLPVDTNFGDRCYYILNDIKERIKCNCGCQNYIKSIKTKYLRGHGNKMDDIINKKTKTYLEKWSVSNPSQSQIVKQKKIDTYIQHYGTSHYMKNIDNKNEVKETCFKKYGVDNPFQIDFVKQICKEKWQENKQDIIEKIKNSNLDNFYSELVNGDRLKNKFIPLFTREEYVGINNSEKKYLFKCIKCGDECESWLNSGELPRCLNCHPYINSGGQSKIEKDLVDYIRIFNKDIIVHDRKTITGFELDIFDPIKNIAVELDSLYWHSEITGGKTHSYHLNKSKLCELKNIRLIHIFDDEWNNKNKIVKHRLKHIFGCIKNKIYARKCIIKEIDKKVSHKFLDLTHIQGADKSILNLGAFYKNRLVAVMTFGKQRKALGRDHIEGNWELSRFSTVRNFNIIGVASKFLKYFINNYNPNKIISYADRRWSQGNLYYKLGFKLKNISKPNYWYTINYKERLHRFNFRKDRLPLLFEVFDLNLSEWQNMMNNNYDRIWDCGNYVFEMILNRILKETHLCNTQIKACPQSSPPL